MLKGNVGEGRSFRGVVPPRSVRGFTLIELLVVIAIIAILAAILFPVFSQARAKAYQATCTNNTRQIAMAVAMYVQDHDEILPYSIIEDTPPSYQLFWWGAIQPYHKSWQLYRCPGDQQTIRSRPWWGAALPPAPLVDLSYGWNHPHMPYRPRYNPTGTSLAIYTYPAEAMVAMHSEAPATDTWSKRHVYCPIHWRPGTLPQAPEQNVTDDHFDGTCAALLDGHSKWYRKSVLIYGDYSSGGFIDRFWAHYVGGQ